MVTLIGIKKATGVLESLTIKYTVTSGVRREVESNEVVLTKVYIATELAGNTSTYMSLSTVFSAEFNVTLGRSILFDVLE